MKHNILIVGSGGREHAVGWKLKQSSKVGKIYFAPGNGGTSQLGENVNIKASDINQLLQFAISHKIDLTVVGPEDPLSLGIVDHFKHKKLMIFGPTKNAAQVETSKAWAVEFMKRNKIPQPFSYPFKDHKKALDFVRSHDPLRIVIKASGLALGKGVILPQTKKKAIDAVENMMIKKEFGDAGNEIIIQERLSGPEVSLLALTDGTTIVPLISAQDHKRIFDNDKGPNTGGMGAYAPVPFFTKQMEKEVSETILKPTITGMKKEGIPYQGVLYAGLMMTNNGPKVLEFNARFGDPETQPIMMMFKSDLFDALYACANETLGKEKITFHRGSSICVVIASKGYPGHYDKGETIHGLNTDYGKEKIVFQAGTTTKDGHVVTNGGRVLGVTAKGKDIRSAIKEAYSIIGEKGVYFNGMQYRKDIGKKVLQNLK